MSKLDELIQELCPDGVEFRKLGEISQYCKERIDASTVDKTCYVGVENLLQNKQGKTLSSAVPTTGQVIAFSFGDILIGNIRPYLKKIWLADCNGGTNGDVLAIHITDSGMLPEFLYYVLSSDSFFHYDMQYAKGSKMPRGSKEAVLQYITPVPPLPVQREIVRILDNFTEITQKLTTELAAELIDRKQQYEYYRNRLLTFDVRGEGTSRTEWRMFGETCFLQAGKAIDAENISKEKTLEYCIPCYGGNGLRGYVRKANQKGEKPLVGRQGALCGNVCFAKGDYYATEHAVVVTDRGFYNSRFLYHLLVNKNLNQYKTAGAQPGLSVTKLETILLPVPETEIQNRIADVLDNFDAICTALSSGLPAEIEARQKQYEYYRDKLLTFTPAD